MTRRSGHRAARPHPIALLLLFGLTLLASLALAGVAGAGHTPPGTYVNPAYMTSDRGLVTSFADPAIIQGRDGAYYAYATADPLNDSDRDPANTRRSARNIYNFHRVPVARSTDLVHWTYVRDALARLPAFAREDAGIWAPDIQFMNGRYYLYYTVTETRAGGSAIGVATSENPAGPFEPQDTAVVEPHPPYCCPDARRWVFDPFVLQTPGQNYIFYGSYFGGISARRLSADGFSSDRGSQTQITIPNRYEGAYIVRRGGFYYFFGSASDCCRGPITGYSVFAGRSLNPLGPYVDKFGVPLFNSRVGGTTVIAPNGNRWVGPGHNAVITDMAGQDWFVYHAIDRTDGYLDPDPTDPADPDPFNINKRPMLFDRLEWVDGWPTVRADNWASDTPQPAPVTGPGRAGGPPIPPRPIDQPGELLGGPTDEFSRGLEAEWRWVREPAASSDAPSGARRSTTDRQGHFTWETQRGPAVPHERDALTRADIAGGSNNAAVLIRDAPDGDFILETKFDFNLPPGNPGRVPPPDIPGECCFNFQQAGIVLYQDDDRHMRLMHVSIWDTRQTEFARDVAPGDPAQPPARNLVDDNDDGIPDRTTPNIFGTTVIGPPGEPEVAVTTTWLRIVKRGSTYTGYSSIDGANWVRGGTWVQTLNNLWIGLASMGRQCYWRPDPDDPPEPPNYPTVGREECDPPYTAHFDYVRVYRLAAPPGTPPAPPRGGPGAPTAGCTIRGTADDDVLVGTPRADVICGGAGNDTIRGLAGADLIYGGGGGDSIYGGPGDDRIRAGGGGDLVRGGDGTDRITGGAGGDRLEGDAADDRIAGGTNGDTLLGWSGADTLIGGAGRDQLAGMAGNDLLITRDRVRDQVNGGAGIDRARADRVDRLRLVERS